MPGPFPGMDPYLEESRRWSGVHARLIAVIGEMLTDLVAPRFYVEIETHVYVVAPETLSRRTIRPDVYVVSRPPSESAGPARGIITAPTVIEPQYPTELRQHYLEIRDAGNEAVVATIELLSPANKAAEAPGYTAFYEKRRQVMASLTHWLEIDLLRAGERPEEVAGRSDYYALLKRGGATRLEVWDIDLRDRLPTVALPLRPPLDDAPLDLQAALDTVYDRNRYGDRIDYTGPVPSPRLAPADAAWADERVRAWLAGLAARPTE